MMIRGNGRPLGRSGMTLVEVMITLGVSAGLLTGILSLVQYSNKAVKNVSSTTEWNMYVANIEQALINDPDGCNGAFAATLTNPANPNGNPIPNTGALRTLTVTAPGEERKQRVTTPLFLNRVAPDGRLTAATKPLIDPRPGSNNYGGAFIINSFDLVGDPARWTPTLPTVRVGAQTFQKRPVLLFINGTKPNSDGANAALGGKTLRNDVGIPLTILTGPGNANTIQGCFGANDAAIQACENLGGEPNLAGLPDNRKVKCTIRPLVLTGPEGDQGGPAGTDAGTIIQLSSNTPGEPNPADASIGVNRTDTNAPQLWFNIGGNNSAYTWHNTTGTATTGFNYDAMRLSTRNAATATGTEIGTELTIGNPAFSAGPTTTSSGASVLRFGNPNVTSGAASGEYIRSPRTANSPDNGNLMFYTNHSPRLSLDRDGTINVRQRAGNLDAILFLGDPVAVGTNTFYPASIRAGWEGGNTNRGSVSIFPRSAIAGNSPSASIDMDDDFGLSLNATAGKSVNIGGFGANPLLRAQERLITITGGLTIRPAPGAPVGPGPGNVMYGCRTVVADGFSMQKHRESTEFRGYVMCDEGEIAIGGGGECAGPSKFLGTNPTMGNEGRGLTGNGRNERARGWAVRCGKDGDGPLISPEGVWATCCK